MFLGREKELIELEKRYKKNTFQMVVIYGRRRIGKTSLIQEFLKDKKSIYFMAVESGITANLELFSISVYHAFLGEEAAVMPSFQNMEKVFSYIGQKAEKEKIVLAIDEYPYLAQSDSSVSSVLQRIIDHNWKQKNIMVILCGSSMSFMENQVLGYKSPLYGRRTAQIRVEAMDYYETSMFTSCYSPEEKALAYGITGGVPQYLELIDDTLSLKENIMDMYLNRSAYLFEEPMNLMKQEMKEPANYNAIIEVIAKGSTKLNEISTKVRIEGSNTSNYLKTLISLGLIEKETAITEEDNKKKTCYRLMDQMFRFWYRYVPKSLFLINEGKAERAYERLVEPDLNNYMGNVFEKMCIQYVAWLSRKDKLPFEIFKLGRWWGNNPQLKRQEEIDLLGVNDLENKALFGECKYRNEMVDMEIINTLYNRAELFSKYTQKAFIFFSKSGFNEAVRKHAKENEHVILVELGEMYERDYTTLG